MGASLFAEGCHDVVGADGSVYYVAPAPISPKPIFSTDPVYPKSAQKDKLEGPVVIEVVVGANGRVRGARVVKSLRKDLDKRALRTVQTWRFKPAIVCDKPSGLNLENRS